MAAKISDEHRVALVALGYAADAIDKLTPKIAAEILDSKRATVAPATLPVTVARFNCLPDTTVAEVLTPTWDAWLEWLAVEPADGYRGDMAHGGWSPVRYDPPQRARANVKEAFALVLDYDRAARWDAVRALWADSYGLIYTTKSHTDVSHRLRVVLVLDRTVSPDEYDRLWKWGARRSKDAGFEADGQAKDVSRFWYDPTPPAGQWRAERLTGAPLSTDAVLALVEPPKLRVVHTPLPISDDERCKRAVAYLAKIPGAVSGAGGHTATFNAVATMMFGFDLSESDARALILNEYNPRCDPPWSEKEIDHKISSVSATCKRERGYLLREREPIHTPRQAASQAPPAATEISVDWTELLLTKKDRTPKRGYHNVLVFVRHHPEYRGKWSLNTMTGDVWFSGQRMHDTFVHDIRSHADQRLGFSPGREDVEAAVQTSAVERPFHPIQQYLRSIDWDGEPRLSAMASDYLGAELPLYAELVRKWMISAVARAVDPGCKVDTSLMLYGEQGTYKSSFFSILGGPWHADSPIDISSKDSFGQIHAAWIYEFAELENVVHGRAESKLKAWLTSTHDMFRAPYARVVQNQPRSCVICGTTNRKQFLTDDTGSRRFWIVHVKRPVPRELLAEMRDQLWAEAVAAYDAGESWWLSGAADAEREDLNADFADSDPWFDRISEYLRVPSRTQVTVTELLEEAVKVPIDRQDRWSQMRAAKALSQAGWLRVRESCGSRSWKYVSPETQASRYEVHS